MQTILDILEMTLGSLPIKYLGVPVLNEKLSYSDRGPLLDKLYNMISSSFAFKLPYGTKLQLINADCYL